ncbi:alpha/beta fold hydrolase [Parablastomonas sp. CN1-191]|uniref:alpha/beta fold hydrolase n=1 Tax=Parablastomonas sp. CN1-191 TaxID=3400908 RepID=UPI003BF8A1FA
MPHKTVNGIELAYETHGDPAHPPLLLIMGLGAQLTLWPEEFVEALVERGFYVIRHDNRDIGLSTKFTGAGVPNIRRVAVMRLFGLRPRLPYRLSDMAADAVGLLDALGVARAHIVGASMGGMIAQLVAATYPGRVLSLTSIMSTTGGRRLPPPRPAALAALTQRPPATIDEDGIVAVGTRIVDAIGSPGYPTDPQRLRARILRDFHRSFHPTGPARQMAAIIDDGDRTARLAAVTAPTLVIHGSDDPLVRVEGGRATAKAIRGATMIEYPGMGHDIPLPLVGAMADAIADHAGAAAQPSG